MNEEWRFRAACIGEDPDIFHRISKDDPGYEEMNAHERKKVEIVNFQKAMAICGSCSVRAECRTEGEREYVIDGDVIGSASTHSIWGGEAPSGYSFRGTGRPPKGTSDALADRMCRNGHVGDFRREGSGYKCRTCIRERRRDGPEPEPFKSLEQRHEEGEFGHEYDPKVYSGRTRCKTCKVEYERARRGQPVDWDTRHESRQGHKPDWRERTGGRWCATCDKQRQSRRYGIRVDTGA